MSSNLLVYYSGDKFTSIEAAIGDPENQRAFLIKYEIEIHPSRHWSLDRLWCEVCCQVCCPAQGRSRNFQRIIAEAKNQYYLANSSL